MRTTARSVTGSAPTTLPSTWRPSARVASTTSALQHMGMVSHQAIGIDHHPDPWPRSRLRRQGRRNRSRNSGSSGAGSQGLTGQPTALAYSNPHHRGAHPPGAGPRSCGQVHQSAAASGNRRCLRGSLPRAVRLKRADVRQPPRQGGHQNQQTTRGSHQARQTRRPSAAWLRVHSQRPGLGREGESVAGGPATRQYGAGRPRAREEIFRRIPKHADGLHLQPIELQGGADQTQAAPARHTIGFPVRANVHRIHGQSKPGRLDAPQPQGRKAVEGQAKQGHFGRPARRACQCWATVGRNTTPLTARTCITPRVQ